MRIRLSSCNDRGGDSPSHPAYLQLMERCFLQDPHLALIGDLKVSVSGLCRLGGLPITTVEPPRLRLGGDFMAPTPAQHR